MTVKELAKFTGKNKSTVGRWVAKCNSKSISEKMEMANQYNPADFSIDEIEEILYSGSMSKDAVRILMENARNSIPSPRDNGSILTRKDLEMVGAVLSGLLGPLDKRLTALEKRLAEPEKKALPAPMIETRQLVNKAVNDFARMKGGSHTAVWNELYRWYDYYNHTNVKLSAKNRRMKTIDYVEKIGMMENLLSVAEKVFF